MVDTTESQIARRVAEQYDGAKRVLCYGCSKANACQLGLTLEAAGPDRIAGTVTFPDWCEGGPGVVHGGYTMAALDEIAGTVHAFAGILAVTSTFECVMHRPVPVGIALDVVGELVGISDDQRIRHARATIVRPDGKLLAEAAGRFVVRDPLTHFTRAAAANYPQPPV